VPAWPTSISIIYHLAGLQREISAPQPPLTAGGWVELPSRAPVAVIR
jgi:hypothetical protein